MSCGAKNEHNDVCGETYTCAACNSGDNVGRLRGRIAELERALKTAYGVIADSGCSEDLYPWDRCDGRCDNCKAIAEIKAVLGEK